jgi:hypothetical protein
MKSQANYLAPILLRHFRKELASLNLVNRHRRSAWEKRGAKSWRKRPGAGKKDYPKPRPRRRTGGYGKSAFHRENGWKIRK